MATSSQLRTLSLFSGGGGLDLGFSAAGYEICCSLDSDVYSCNTLVINEEKKPFYSQSSVINKDITTLSSNDLLNEINLNATDIDVIIGGPPCQAFSVFGKRKGLADPRGNLVWEYLRFVQDIRPSVFVFENVSGMKTIHNGGLYNELFKALEIDGEYTVTSHEYELADFGIPQFRKRIFFVGSKNKVSIPEMLQTHGVDDLRSEKLPYVTVGKVLANMPSPGQNSSIPNHIGREHSQRIIDRYSELEFGERDKKTRINKLHPERPSFTIIVGSNAGGGKGHVHPYQPREVTPRESARLQTFPDWWEFDSKGRHVIRQVGNAVPPLFAALLAEHIKVHAFGLPKTHSYLDFIDILELDYMK